MRTQRMDMEDGGGGGEAVTQLRRGGGSEAMGRTEAWITLSRISAAKEGDDGSSIPVSLHLKATCRRRRRRRKGWEQGK